MHTIESSFPVIAREEKVFRRNVCSKVQGSTATTTKVTTSRKEKEKLPLISIREIKKRSKI